MAIKLRPMKIEKIRDNLKTLDYCHSIDCANRLAFRQLLNGLGYSATEYVRLTLEQMNTVWHGLMEERPYGVAQVLPHGKQALERLYAVIHNEKVCKHCGMPDIE